MGQGVTGKIAYVPSGYLRAMAGTLAEIGCDFTAESRACGYAFADYLDSPHGLPRAHLESLDRFFVALTPDRHDLWLDLGCRLRLPAYGTMGLAYLTAPSVSHMMSLCDEFEGLACSMASQRHAPLEGGEGLVLDLADVPADIREFTVARDIGTSLACLGDAWTARFPLNHVTIAREYERLLPLAGRFGIAVRRSDEQTALVWEPRLSSRPLFNGDPHLHSYYKAECRKLREPGAFGDAFLDRVGDAVEVALKDADTRLSLERIAGFMHVSARTLQRRLSEHDISFREICDTVRRRMAEQMLRNMETPVAEVAYRLGYAEPASFHHAFKRWSGQSPQSFRRNGQAALSLPAR
ncbi:MAG: AraC family transcriptional regulator [Sphingomonadales bacterium]|nr:AraC family transcriptional regulator [Sphingomonadales bacterium]